MSVSAIISRLSESSSSEARGVLDTVKSRLTNAGLVKSVEDLGNELVITGLNGHVSKLSVNENNTLTLNSDGNETIYTLSEAMEHISEEAINEAKKSSPIKFKGIKSVKDWRLYMSYLKKGKPEYDKIIHLKTKVGEDFGWVDGIVKKDGSFIGLVSGVNSDYGNVVQGDLKSLKLSDIGSKKGTSLDKAIEKLDDIMNGANERDYDGEEYDDYGDIEESEDDVIEALQTCFDYDGWKEVAKQIKFNVPACKVEAKKDKDCEYIQIKYKGRIYGAMDSKEYGEEGYFGDINNQVEPDVIDIELVADALYSDLMKNKEFGEQREDESMKYEVDYDYDYIDESEDDEIDESDCEYYDDEDDDDIECEKVCESCGLIYTGLDEEDDSCCEACGGKLYERYVKVVRAGKVVKKKLRRIKVRLSAAQKQALAKARRFAHTGSANKARRKSMKVRRRKGL